MNFRVKKNIRQSGLEAFMILQEIVGGELKDVKKRTRSGLTTYKLGGKRNWLKTVVLQMEIL